MAQKILPPSASGGYVATKTHRWRTLTCCHCGHNIKVLIDCNNRFCPACSPRRSARIRSRLGWLIKNMQKKTGFRLKMITLSATNCSDVQQGIVHLVASFRKMRNRALFKNHVDGGAFVIEVTGRPGHWHPHIHAIIYSRYIPWRALWRDWKQCSGGNAVWITSVAPSAAAAYITKYISKSAVPVPLQIELSEQLKQFRLFQRFGCWHNLKLPSRVYDYKCEQCGGSDWLADRDFKKKGGVRIKCATDWLFVGL